MVSPEFHATPGVDVCRLESGRVVIRVSMAPKTAAIVFFGTK